jgi:8-oxo-dGTP diphosphatase
MWEFPGGKIEPGEERVEALKREIGEELAVEIVVEELVCTVEYDYPNFHLTMHCYFCCIANGEVELLEHKSARWLAHNELDSVEWLPADVSVVNSLRQQLMVNS